jgi:PIN domain nuclease of toxin-antitoxin system
VARFLLDTQAFIVLTTEGLNGFSPRPAGIFGDLENDILLSAVSVTEIAVKSNIGKLAFTTEKVSVGAADLRLTIIPYTQAHANRLFALPLHHRDPFDRMLIATALAENIPLIGADKEFKKYRGLKVIW